MRLLFTMDRNDHAACTHTFARPSARAVILRDGKVAMVHSLRFGYYKFPGGGIEAGETPEEAMIRETSEETGLTVRRESVRPYGRVHRVQRSDRDPTERFVQDNYYFLCRADGDPGIQALDDYEAGEGFSLAFVTPEEAIRANRRAPESCDPVMLEREARVLILLLEEGLLKPSVKIVKVERDAPLREELIHFVAGWSWEEVREHTLLILRRWTFSDWEAVFAARADDRIVGMATFLRRDYYPLPEVYPWISTLFVAEAYRGRGICGQLIDRANAYARACGFERTYIPTEFTGLYERYGYRFLREIVNYAKGTDRLYVKELK